MKIKVNTCVYDSDTISQDAIIKIKSSHLNHQKSEFDCKELIAYSPFINSHDHLVGNWVPRAGTNNPYPTTDIWVEEMKQSESYLERNRVWFNDGKFDLTKGNANLLTSLGIYKNIFSGCSTIQDHAPNQKDEYYERFPIKVIKKYKQCHSLSMGNWWGGKSAVEELKATKGKMPFILHLAEGTNEKARSAFVELEKLNLLQPNTLIIHGIALTKEDIKKCSEIGTSICCCPESNLFLIGRTIDIKTCFEFNVNLVLGTDSTMSGSSNILSEIKIFKKQFPEIPMKKIFKLFTSNAQKALFLPDSYGKLNNETSHVLLIKKKNEDPFDNLLETEMEDIELLLHQGSPIYGNQDFLNAFDIKLENYFFFELGKTKKFVIGHPEKITQEIDSILGYHKDFPYLPF